MKKLVLAMMLCWGVCAAHAQGQIFDAVSIGPGYTNQTFYSMANGEVSSIINNDWDLAFQIAGFQAAIVINGKNNVRLFKSGFAVNDWANILPIDTTGQLTGANELFNRDTSIWAGAFNITADFSNQFDLGWGVYDFVTHAVTGDSLYFIKLPNNSYKKLWIQVLQNGIYTFKHANLDGSNETTVNLSKQNFSGKNFGYYSFTTNTTFDREPNKYSWDLVFSQYMSSMPLTYKVSGVLSNDSIFSLKAYPVDVATVSPWQQGFTKYSNNIGYSWKTFDMNTNQWVIEDSTVFFLYDRSNALWKLVFTGFGGASTGTFEFYKELVSATGVGENGSSSTLLEAYPNPAKDLLRLVFMKSDANTELQVSLHDLNGRVVLNEMISNGIGLMDHTMDVSQLTAGIYTAKVLQGSKIQVKKVVVGK